MKMNIQNKFNLHKQRGLSLIELMIALVIGLILTAGTIQIFLSTKATYRLETALSRMQETGRFIIDLMAREIRMAGFNGCTSRGTITPNVIAKDPPPMVPSANNAVNGFEASGPGTWSPAIPANLFLAGVRSGTDVLTINRADECGVSVAGNFLPINANVQVHWPNSCGFTQNQPVLITDCVDADIYQISNNPSGSGKLQTTAHARGANTTNRVSKAYGPDSLIFKFLSNTFYIADGASGEPALWLSTWDPGNPSAVNGFVPLELADGVEDMQILYGLDNGGGNEYADTYVTADAVPDWIDVRSARINLLLRSDDRVTEEPRSVTFNGAVANSGAGADRRLRMIYSSTISLRNRLP